MIVKDEILFELERRFQRLLYLILVLFIIISTLFLIFIGRFDTNPFKLQQEIDSTIQLKLSSNDLVSLFNSEDYDRWTNVQLIERNRDVYTVKIKHASEYTFNFKMSIDGTVYNLFRVGQQGKEIYDFFKTASNWGLETSSPQLAQLKVNNVFIGIYLMEERIYEQIRDENGQYFIRLGSDVLLLKRILYQTRAPTQPRADLVVRYFDTSKLASYLVFFSFFSFEGDLDYDRLVFRYDPQVKKFLPYLTMESIILSLEEQNKVFKLPPSDNPGFYRELNRSNINHLLGRISQYKYGPLMRKVLVSAKDTLFE
jgi:hypothetical protein